MWLVCPKDREAKCLGKSMAGGWYSAPSQESLTEFYDKHGDCCVPDIPFEFRTENEDGWMYRTENGVMKIIKVRDVDHLSNPVNK